MARGRFDTPVDHTLVTGIATEVSEIGYGAGRGARKGAGVGILAGMAVVGLPLAVVGGLLGAWIGAGAIGAIVVGALVGGAAGAVGGGIYGGTAVGVLGTVVGAIKGLFVGGHRIHKEKAAATQLNMEIQQAHAEGAQHAREMQTQMIDAARTEQQQRAAFIENILARGKAEEKPHVERVEENKNQQPSQGAGLA